MDRDKFFSFISYGKECRARSNRLRCLSTHGTKISLDSMWEYHFRADSPTLVLRHFRAHANHQSNVTEGLQIQKT